MTGKEALHLKTLIARRYPGGAIQVKILSSQRRTYKLELLLTRRERRASVWTIEQWQALEQAWSYFLPRPLPIDVATISAKMNKEEPDKNATPHPQARAHRS